VSARRVFLAVTALVVLGVGAAVLVATAIAWVPCGGGLYSDACLGAMDQPGNSDIVTTGWLLALGLCAIPALLSIRGSSTLRPALAIGAFGVVLIGNPMRLYWPEEALPNP
jgi:hypothetical protein